MSSNRIFEAFAKAPKPVWRKARKAVWTSGVPADLRLSVWQSSLGDGNDELFEAGASALSFADAETLPEDLLFQLEALYTSPTFKSLTKEQVERIGLIVQCHIENIESEAEAGYIPGSVQVVARILRDYGGTDPSNDHKLLGVYSKLGETMKHYTEGERFKDDFALLLAVMRHELKDLCLHFDKLEIDVMDVVSVVEVWVTTLFSDGFPSDLGFRVMDVVMINGVSNIIFIVYGILKLRSQSMQMINDSKRLYEYITRIPELTEFDEVKSIFTLSLNTIKSLQSKIEMWRKENTWSKEICGRGPIMFVSKATPQKHGDSKLYEDPFMHEDSGDDETQEKERSELIGTLESMMAKANDHMTKRALEQALDELRAYGPPRDDNSSWPTGTLKRSNRESKGRDSDSRGSTLDSVQREAIAKGFVPYSQLYQYQDFPCLYMEGYLQKPRSNSSLHKRFFVLHGSYLTHFRSHKHRRSQRDIAACVRGATITPIDNSTLAKYGLQITLSNGTVLHTLFADDSQSQQVWIRVLQAASKAEE